MSKPDAGNTEHAYKRPFDLTILILAHLILLPAWTLLWVVVSLAVWIEDRGPILYVQDRVGRDDRVFPLYKFRSMRVRGTVEDWPEFTAKYDPRITLVGRVLRRLALDELPQVINLWKGDISFVGPRPLPTEMHEGYVKEDSDFGKRVVARPGLTGLAQTRLRRHARARNRSRYDRLYIDRASMWLDIKLIALSVWLTLSGQWGRGRREFKQQ
jgi:lipopolysaccharide/colanic/teichoic acid biosynthesis glycosyltransferase